MSPFSVFALTLRWFCTKPKGAVWLGNNETRRALRTVEFFDYVIS